MLIIRKTVQILAAGAIVAGLTVPAYGQGALPAVGTYTGNSRATGAACKTIAPEVPTVMTAEQAAQTNQIFLPIFSDASGYACPVLNIGAAMLLDAASSNAVQELLITPSDQESLALTDLDTRIVDSAVISPTISSDRWLQLVQQASTGANMGIIGMWNVPGGGGAGDTPADLKLWRDAERAMKLEEGGTKLFTVPSTARVARIPSVAAARPIEFLCPAAAGQVWNVEWLSVMPPVDGMMVFVIHPKNELPSVCPYMENFNLLVFDDAWKLLPAKDQQAIDREIDRETTEWKRNLWAFPSADNLQPALQPATIAVTAIGGVTVAWIVFGAGGGSAMAVFSSLQGDLPRLAN